MGVLAGAGSGSRLFGFTLLSCSLIADPLT